MPAFSPKMQEKPRFAPAAINQPNKNKKNFKPTWLFTLCYAVNELSVVCCLCLKKKKKKNVSQPKYGTDHTLYLGDKLDIFLTCDLFIQKLTSVQLNKLVL